MKQENVTQFDKAEALDRIHVIQTMLSELLFRNECKPHRGLSPYTAHLVEQVHEKLCEAYQSQGAFTFEEDENVDDDYTSGNNEMGRRMQSNLQKLVAAGKVNLEALSCFQELKRKDDDV